tara:strand:- start:68 stop:568 length:501 start_codon:yes stop_codon:yes gene_type:complete
MNNEHTKSVKVSASQQKLLEADNRLRAINKKRDEMFVEEEAAAKQVKAKAEKAIRREAALEILLPIRDRMNSGEKVTGTRRSSFQINMMNLKNINTPSRDFVITNVHIGRKHLGVHVRYEGSQKEHWVRVQLLHNQNHALHDGSQYIRQETSPSKLRELIEEGECL